MRSFCSSFHIPRWQLALLKHSGMNPDQMLLMVTWKVMKKARYYFSLYVICVYKGKKIATTLSLVNLCSLSNLRHSTSVSLLRQTLALALSHPLLYSCSHVLECAIHHRYGLYKLKITDCYNSTTCEIIHNKP